MDRTDHSAAQDPAGQDGRPTVLVFLHIPKAGGTTLGHVISRQYPPEAYCEVTFDRLDTFDRFFALSDRELEKIRCIKGHFPFGIHTRVPARPVYVTMLRDPVKRFISEYRFLKEFPRVRPDLPVPDEALASFGAYLDHCIAAGALNWQVRQAGGFLPLGELTVPLPPLPADALEQAIANLDRHCVVTGVLPRFDESLVLMKRKLGWEKGIHYLRENVNKAPQPTGDVSEADRRRLFDHVELDRKLYAYAEQRLERDLAAQGPDFAEELARFKRKNGRLITFQRNYQRWVPGPLRRALRKLR